MRISYIVNRYAILDNIKYLELRCAVDGYSKLGLQSKEEAIEALFRGFNEYSKRALHDNRKKIQINIIVTAKRHKTTKEFEENVSLALRYRYGLDLSDTQREKGKEKTVNFNNSNLISFFGKKTRVVSFDLAGLEKGNRPSKFYHQFFPLLQECFPITIHAGEEDNYESIWEAIYLVQSQRIGHGLTLRKKEVLLNIVRERHVTIELCPISNILTNDKFRFNINEKFKDVLGSKQVSFKQEEEQMSDIWYKEDERAYPLRQYLDNNLDVTINTDNPFISDSNMTKEYIVGASLIGGLSKWEILRLIKNSFRGAAISKTEKRKLMNEIDEEIYEFLLNES